MHFTLFVHSLLSDWNHGNAHFLRGVCSELLARGRAVSPRADSSMLDILAHTEDGTMLQRYVSDLRSPHKTGSDDGVRTECALWTLPDRVVACVLTRDNADRSWRIDHEAQVLMARMGEAIVRTWRREGAR